MQEATMTFVRNIDAECSIVRSEFDRDWYIERYRDIDPNFIDPLLHFMAYGYLEGRWPNRSFDPSYYLACNPDVAASEVHPFVHFVTSGKQEERLGTEPGTYLGHRIGFDFLERNDILPLPTQAGRSFRCTPSIENVSLLVHVHCFWIEEFAQICASLRHLPIKFDLFVTHPYGMNSQDILKAIDGANLTSCSGKRTVACENRGRDVAPLIMHILPISRDYNVCLHLHTKRSVERGAVGTAWLTDLLAKLIYDKTYVQTIIKLITESDRVGMVCPSPFSAVKSQMHWGWNKRLAEDIMAKIAKSSSVLPEKVPEFPAGMMFWFNPQAIKPIEEIALKWNDFPEEPIYDDGTLAHAIERVLPLVVAFQGQRTLFVEPSRTHVFSRLSSREIAVSVIIPVHNCVDWLPTCVNSVLDQRGACPQYEIIIIDDASSDGTESMVEALSHHPLIITARSSNRGAGAARNAGLKLARGKYIMFVDADDIITNDAISCLYDEVVSSNADMAVSQLSMFTEMMVSDPMPSFAYGSLTFPIGRFHTGRSDYTLDDEAERVFVRLLSDFGPCAKLFSRNLLNDHNVSFPEGTNYEDNFFIYHCYFRARSIRIVQRCTYLYRKFNSQFGLTQSTMISIRSFDDQVRVISSILLRIVDKLHNQRIRVIAAQLLLRKLEFFYKEFNFDSNNEPNNQIYESLVSALKIVLQGERLADYE